jgi:hypothetical protein
MIHLDTVTDRIILVPAGSRIPMVQPRAVYLIGYATRTHFIILQIKKKKNAGDYSTYRPIPPISRLGCYQVHRPQFHKDVTIPRKQCGLSARAE